MLNLMVMLIPFLLTSSEFVKIGAIELKLPEQTAGGGGGGGSSQQQIQNVKLDLGVLINANGFNIFSYFKKDNSAAAPAAAVPPGAPAAPGYSSCGREIILWS